jgi:hypothetical protein
VLNWLGVRPLGIIMMRSMEHWKDDYWEVKNGMLRKYLLHYKSVHHKFHTASNGIKFGLSWSEGTSTRFIIPRSK